MACSDIAGQLSKTQAARDYGVSAKIVSRRTERFLSEGRAGMQDHSSRPKLIPNQTAQALAERIMALRRQRLCGKHIALETGVSPATVSRVLRRAGLSRIKDLVPPEPPWPSGPMTRRQTSPPPAPRQQTAPKLTASGTLQSRARLQSLRRPSPSPPHSRTGQQMGGRNQPQCDLRRFCAGGGGGCWRGMLVRPDGWPCCGFVLPAGNRACARNAAVLG